ncbi:MAG: hypothetical protein AB9917_18170 [Negativicutes bacterium]
MRKLLLFTFLLLLAFQSVSFAAASSSRGAPARSAPRVSQPAPAAAPAASGTTSGYKPSAPANSYSDKAPATAVKPQQPAQQPSTGNSFLRSAAMFGGGMLLGSMLGNMFGFGSSGMFSQMIGLLFNVLLIGLIFMAGRYVWNRFRASRERKDINILR